MENQKIIVIGDIHGEELWKDIIRKHPDSKYIFLGDYCDPYHMICEDDVIANLQSIINFKKQASEKIILLLGNHDIQYMYKEAECCTRRMIRAESEIRDIFRTNILLFDWGYKLGNLIFTHAGISQGWFRFSFPNVENSDVFEFITNSTKKEIAFACGYARGGNMPYGGFFWASKSEMNDPLNGFIQIVGHNRVSEITVRRNIENDIVIFCDSLWNGKYLIIEETTNTVNFFDANLMEGIKLNVMSMDKELMYGINGLV